MKYLISQNADVNAKDNTDATPLHMTAQFNSKIEVLTTLIFSGADINAKDKFGNTPLLIAANANPNADVVKYLISLGADVNVVANNGTRAVDVANTEEKKHILREAMRR